MPLYEAQCSGCGREAEYYATVDERAQTPICCGQSMTKLISRVMGFVSPDICYDSPIDGRPITSKQARLEDLARSNCVPYDPEQKTDYKRRIEREQKKLEAKIEETVDREISQMPARKREKLAAEMEGGMDVDYHRSTPPLTPITAELR